MSGWKTWVGVLMLVVGGALSAFNMNDVANVVYSFAVPMVIVGLGHKLDKVFRAIASSATSMADQLEKANTATVPPKV